MIKKIYYKNSIYAIIIRAKYKKRGIEFFTPNDFSQQLAYMRRPKGKVIQPHVHNKVERNITNTLEVLYLKRGKVKVDFYTQSRKYFGSEIISTGDVILLVRGGHGFKFLKESEIIEIKQGPYSRGKDKTKFTPK